MSPEKGISSAICLIVRVPKSVLFIVKDTLF